LFPAVVGHVIVPQSPAAAHVTSHRHDWVHVTLAQAGEPEPDPDEPPPLHATVQAPAPHVMSPHAVSAVHAIMHDAAPVQLICGHAPAVVHAIWQLKPAGHVTLPPAPTIVHVPVGKSHDAHSGGHTGASTAGASGVPTMQ
jgi:hypothetical protein